MLLLLLKQIILLLNESLKAHFFEVTAKVVILLLQVLDVLVFDGDLAHECHNFVLLLSKLFF